MMLKTMVIIFLAWAAILSPGSCFAEEQQNTNPHAEELFSMVDRLEKVKKWTMADIWRIREITGHRPKRTSLTLFASDSQPANKILHHVELSYNPQEDCFTGILLCLPKQGLSITAADIEKKYGKWDEKGHMVNFGEKWCELYGYATIIPHNYKRPGGAWLGFDFDNDASKQLRSIEVVP